MSTSMRRCLKRVARQLASVMMLTFAVVSSAECMLGDTSTHEQRPCCATMHGECDHMAVSSPCCPPPTQNVQGLVATKPTVVSVPVFVLLTVFSSPAHTISSVTHDPTAAETSSAGPPGVPTYLFVSSFRV